MVKSGSLRRIFMVQNRFMRSVNWLFFLTVFSPWRNTRIIRPDSFWKLGWIFITVRWRIRRSSMLGLSRSTIVMTACTGLQIRRLHWMPYGRNCVKDWMDICGSEKQTGRGIWIWSRWMNMARSVNSRLNLAIIFWIMRKMFLQAICIHVWYRRGRDWKKVRSRVWRLMWISHL